MGVPRVVGFAGKATPLLQGHQRTLWSRAAAGKRPPSLTFYVATRICWYSTRPRRIEWVGIDCRRVLARAFSGGRVVLDSGPTSKAAAAASSEGPDFAFAFDIDGVLLHVSKPIRGAAEALRYLQDNHIPFILLTNGGGKHERERAADLSEKLGVQLTTDNFVQSHTPFRELVDGPGGLGDKTVLVMGSDAQKSRSIAEEYGFKNVVIPADILLASPTIWPFDPLLESIYARTARPLPKPLYQPGSGVPLASSLQISAVLIFNDPRDWALDTQLIVDLLLSHAGYLGTYSRLNGSSVSGGGWQGDGQPRLFFSNADLVWSAEYHLPRFAQGAFQAAVAGVWRRVTGSAAELRREVLGKPTGWTYRFAERVLDDHRGNVLARRKDLGLGGGEGGGAEGRLRRVYMVGDNPESDIAGANDYVSERGAEWYSVLVRTGVWSAERSGGVEGLSDRLRPRVVLNDVREVVRWALEREGWKGKF